jgi:hypothetical protein
MQARSAKEAMLGAQQSTFPKERTSTLLDAGMETL